ncbi:phosphopantetheine-binding protein [Gramella sp. AN32]|nr:phosphopantetheine-binding protein [Gramella sp. AN32]MCM4156813.1 acyl carrier protein [Gramella sp. AN32]
MTDQDIISRLKHIVKPYVQREIGMQDFNKQTDFLKDLEINSANLVDVVLDVEDEFGIEVDNDSMQGMLRVGDAVNIINNKKSIQ